MRCVSVKRRCLLAGAVVSYLRHTTRRCIPFGVLGWTLKFNGSIILPRAFALVTQTLESFATIARNLNLE